MEISQLRSVTCHMGSHSVTCHPTPLNTPALTPAVQACTWFSYPEGCVCQSTMGVNNLLKVITQQRSITLQTKLRLLKTLVWPAATRGCESWTLRKTEKRKVDAFEVDLLPATAYPMDGQENERECAARNGNRLSTARFCHQAQTTLLRTYHATPGWMSGVNCDSGMHPRKQAKR